jgi:hypothetical protein
MDSVRADLDRRHRAGSCFSQEALPAGWLVWFLGTLIPVIGLVQVGEAAMADRYAYIPLIGIFVMIAWGLADLAEVKKVRTCLAGNSGIVRFGRLGCVTYRQMSYWDSDYDLWSHTLAVAENPLTHNALGCAHAPRLGNDAT